MFALHCAIVLPVARRVGISITACFRPLEDEGLRKALQMAGPLVVTVILGQWTAIIINRSLSELPPGTLAEFGYAFRLLTVVGILPTVFGTIVFPDLSDATAKADLAEFSRLMNRALRMTLLITVPPTLAFIILSEPTIRL